MDSGCGHRGNQKQINHRTLQELYEMLWNSQILEIDFGPHLIIYLRHWQSRQTCELI